MPLEAEVAHSGVAVIDARHPRQPRFAQAVYVPKSTMYCVCACGAWVYAFGANTHAYDVHFQYREVMRS